MLFVVFEILKGGKLFMLSDIYSFGMFLVEFFVFSWSNLWDGECWLMFIFFKVLVNECFILFFYFDGFLFEVLDSYIDFIKKCWVENFKEWLILLVIVCEFESIWILIFFFKIIDLKVLSNLLVEDVKFRFLENMDDV